MIDLSSARPVTDAEAARHHAWGLWAISLLHDRGLALGDTAAATVDGVALVGRVETHTNPTAENPLPHAHRGISLYYAPGVPRAAPLAHAQGIDVSGFQPTIDWHAVRASGVSFAYVKASEGVTLTDKHFSEHWSGARAAGLLRGAYHFFRIASGQAQIDHFLDTLGNDPGELPPALDVEWQHNDAGRALDGVEPQRFADVVEACLERLAARSGRRPLLYTAPGFASLLPSWSAAARIADLWIASYSREPAPIAPWPRWVIWQYTDRRQVPGVGPDDANTFAGTEVELRAWATGAAPTEPAPADPWDQNTEEGRRRLQMSLNDAGALPRLTVDGIVGDATTRAVRAFQVGHGLRVDGIPGPLTLAKLRAVVAAGLGG